MTQAPCPMITAPSPTNEVKVFPLPSDRARDNVPDQGWHIDTTVGASKIPGAGNGR